MQVLSVPFHGALVQDKPAALDLTQMANDMILRAAHAYPDRFRIFFDAAAAVPRRGGAGA